MSHGDLLNNLPDGFTKLLTENTLHAAISNKEEIGVQFHQSYSFKFE